MGERSLEARVENLENLAESLAPLPGDVRALGQRMARVESEIVQLRVGLGDEISAIRGELAGHARETAGHFLAMQGQLSATQEQIAATQRQMRVLHEDVVERISRLGESR